MTHVTEQPPTVDAVSAGTLGSPKIRRSASVWIWVGGVALIGLLAVGSEMLPRSWGHIFVMTLIYAAFASSWNIVGGFAGQISLGHAGFFGVGAYVSTLLYINFGISPWLGLIAAVLAGAAVAWIVGVPSFRFRGPYFSLATLAIGLILYYLSIQLRSVTMGQAGIAIPYRPSFENMIFPDQWQYVLLAGGLLLVCLLISARIAGSRLGYQLAAVRDDEQAARALGVNASRAKLTAAVLSGGMAAAVGVVYSQYILFLSPDSIFATAVSIDPVVFSIVGGVGTVLGPVLGAALLVPASTLILSQFGGDAPGLHTLVYGVVTILVVLLLPGGIISVIKRIATAIRSGGTRRRADLSAGGADS